MSTTQSSQRTVLVVDDEALIRINAIDMLTDAGFAVVEAGDAAEALEMLEQHPEIGLLFTDINMPGDMDGLELARRVHALRPDVHLIVTSGKVRPTKDEIPEPGDFLAKPYRERQIVGLVNAAFAN